MSRIGQVGSRLYRGEVSVNFVGRKRTWYSISGAILLISVVALLTRGLNFSVDFKGGAVFQFRGGGQAHLPQYGEPRRREQHIPGVTYRLRALADARHLTFHLPSLPDGIGCPRPALTCGDVDVILMGYRRTLGCEP